MGGKNRRRWAGALPVLAAIGLLLTSAGSRSMAASSPAEDARRPAASAEAFPQQAARKAPRTVITDGGWPSAAQEPFSSLVPESEPAPDEYFDDAVFLGDSRTEGFQLYSGFGHGTYFHAVGATVASVFTKAAWETPEGKIPLLDAVAQTDCGKIYVMLGVNELGWPGTDDFTEQYKKLIDRLREDHPEAQIVLQSILPVSAKQDAKKSYVNNERIALYNEMIEALAAEKGCYYVNVAEAVAGPDGCLRADWNYDGIHLNPPGCRAWLHYLQTHSVG